MKHEWSGFLFGNPYPMPDGWDKNLKQLIADGKKVEIAGIRHFDKLVKSVRVALGLNKREFADLLRVERQAVHLWESNKCHPHYDMEMAVRKIAMQILLFTGEVVIDGYYS